jgi:hypothetical protein
MLLKKRKGRRISNRKLRRLLLRTDIVDAFNLNISQVEDKLNKSYQDYKRPVLTQQVGEMNSWSAQPNHNLNRRAWTETRNYNNFAPSNNNAW